MEPTVGMMREMTTVVALRWLGCESQSGGCGTREMWTETWLASQWEELKTSFSQLWDGLWQWWGLPLCSSPWSSWKVVFSSSIWNVNGGGRGGVNYLPNQFCRCFITLIPRVARRLLISTSENLSKEFLLDAPETSSPVTVLRMLKGPYLSEA